MEPEASFGAWLEKRRKALDLTREELSHRAGCSVSALRKIETDERRPSKQLAGILADCLEIPIEDRSSFLKFARGEQILGQIHSPTPLPTLKPIHEDPAPRPATHLPSPPTPLVGREQELRALGQLLTDPQCRIITLVGPGGIGKTRLAIQAAADQCLRFRDGAFFVGLSGLSYLDHVIPAIAEALQFSFYGVLEPKIQLFNFLHEKELLLILDNFEQLIQGAGLVSEITEKSPGVKLLVTSREQLNVRGEWTFEVNGLSYPVSHSSHPLGFSHSFEDHSGDRPFEDYSAVALFIQAASRARVGYKIEAEDYPAIAQICRLVDGIPLGIELASTWVRTLTCTEIAREIETSLDFLATTGWGILERHKSMRAVFDHSWNLLSEEEQRVLGWLSVFRGDFSRQAAEQIAGASLSILSSLIAKSFLRRQSSGRYDLHELLRQYAESKARTTRQGFEEVAGRHSAYYLEIVRNLELPIVGPKPVAARAEFVADMENIRPAWEYAVRHDQVELIKGSINSFWNFYENHTWFHEAVATFGLAADELERTRGGSSHMDAAHIILYEYLRCCQGWFYLHIGKFQEARSILEEGVQTLRSSGALAELSRSLHYLGVIYWQAGEYSQALELFHEKLELDLPGGITRNLGLAYGNLGMVTETMGLLQESCDHLQKADSIFRLLGDLRLLGVGLFYLGSVKNKLGMVQEGKTHLYESLKISRSIGDRFGISMASNCLGLVFQKEKNHAEAVSMFQESLNVSREMGEKWITLQSLVNLGFSKYELSDPAEAKACFLQALQLASVTQLVPCILDSLAGMALIYDGQGKSEETLELVMHIQDHPAMTQDTKVRVDQLYNEIKVHFSEAQIKAIYTRSQAKPIEMVVEDILATSN